MGASMFPPPSQKKKVIRIFVIFVATFPMFLIFSYRISVFLPFLGGFCANSQLETSSITMKYWPLKLTVARILSN